MIEKIPPIMEALTVRRTGVVDSDKVRYRVYSTPSEFVAVIAESALMAVRASGIKVPYKIVRDIPGADNGLLSAKNMQNATPGNDQVQMGIKHKDRLTQYFTELTAEEKQEPIIFVPMGIADLQNKGMSRARILPAEMLYEIIEEHAKHQENAAPMQDAELPAPIEEVYQEEIREPELSPAEKLAELADEVFSTNPPATAVEASGIPDLTPEEVEKLLNGDG